jgi:DNA-binding response OmpR family regulator
MSGDEIRPTDELVGAPLRAHAHPCHRILVADDESAIRRLMTTVLVHSGYRVDVAEDGAAAWEALQANPYDLLISDNNMPKITGVELVRKLRSARHSLPVIIITGTVSAHELAQDPSLQLAAILEKPITIAMLLDTVENILRATDSPASRPFRSQTGEANPQPAVYNYETSAPPS